MVSSNNSSHFVFQVLYRYLYHYLIQMLNLREVDSMQLPLPSSFISGALFSAIFCSDTSSGSENDDPRIMKIRQLRSQILASNEDAVSAVFK